jgi:hypothetical protein
MFFWNLDAWAWLAQYQSGRRARQFSEQFPAQDHHVRARMFLAPVRVPAVSARTNSLDTLGETDKIAAAW